MRACFIAFVVSVLLLWTRASVAAPPAATDYLLPQHAAFFSIRPRSIGEFAVRSGYDPSAMTEGLLREVGLKLTEIEHLLILFSVDVFQADPAAKNRLPAIVLVLTASGDAPQGAELLARVVPKAEDRRSERGTTYRINPQGWAGFSADERTLVLGRAADIEAILNRPAPPAIDKPFAQAVSRLDRKLVFEMHATPRFLAELPQIKAAGTLNAEDLDKLLLSTRVTVSAEMNVEVILAGRDAAAADTLLGMASASFGAMRAGNRTAIAQFKALAGGEPDGAATILLWEKMADFYDSIGPEKQENSVVIKATGERIQKEAVPAYVSILKSVDNARKAARQAQARNNLVKILLAMHYYIDAKRSLPPAYLADKGGKPLLSWRVALLPYLDQGDLYAEFRLDEAWDSPHNKKLIPRMPAIFASPHSKLSAQGKTTYLAVRGPRSAFRDNVPRKFADVRDDTGKTGVMLEVDDAQAVEWTRPDDVSIDGDKAAGGLTSPLADEWYVGFVDGHAQAITKKATTKLLREMFDTDDGLPAELPK